MQRILRPSRARERAVLGVLAVYVIVALVLLTPVRSAVGDQRQAALPPPPASAVADPESAPSAPTAGQGAPKAELDAGQRERAELIVAADRFLAAALDGVSYSVPKAGPWTTMEADGGPSRVLGAAFVVTPEAAVDLRSVKLPGALYDQSERTDPPYQTVSNKVSGEQIKQFLVLVDLERDRVVSITPGPGAGPVESTPLPGFKRTVPLPEEGEG